jgi:hypothetical protein
VVPDNHSRLVGGTVERVTGVAPVTFALLTTPAYNPAAIALAASTSGPGSGTKIVRR